MLESKIKDLKNLINKYGLELNNVDLIVKALTHPTYVFENKKEKLESNQRLEFLGDAILGLIVAHYLFENYPELPEGELTKMRAAVVCEPTLAEVAREIGLGDYLFLGRGEELTGGKTRNSNLADAFEALIGALYLEVGYERTENFVIKLLENEIEKTSKGAYRDFKTVLQEKVQELYAENVEYRIITEEGPDHDKVFSAGVYFQEKLLAKGSGKSKKEAEQNAAENALRIIAEDRDD